MVQYNVRSSSNTMAAQRLKPLPATPFSGWGIQWLKILFQCLPVCQRSAQCETLIQSIVLSLMSNKLHHLGFLINFGLCDLDKISWSNKLNKMTTYWINCLSIHFLLINTWYGSNNCLDPSRHTFYEVLAYLWWNFIPLLYQSIPQFMNSMGRSIIFAKLAFKMVPEMFNGVEVWRLCWPW